MQSLTYYLCLMEIAEAWRRANEETTLARYHYYLAITQ
jgi:hypothetical protein